MDETSFYAKRRTEGLSSFQTIAAHDLAHWDSFPLQVALNETHFFSNWDSLDAKLNSHCKTSSYKKKKHRKIKTTENLFRKKLQSTVNRCLLIVDLKPYLKTRTTEPSDGFLCLRET